MGDFQEGAALISSQAAVGMIPQIVGAHSTGAQMIAELPEGLGLPAWQALRAVLRWALEEPASSGDIFVPTAMREWEVELLQSETGTELYQYLAVLIGELAEGGSAAPELLAPACMGAADWALEGNFTVTALAFAEAAALCWIGQNPRYAWTAGHLMQANGRPREAEVWLRCAERTAAESGDRLVQALALRSRGDLHRSAGRDRDAGKLFRDALRVASRAGVREEMGDEAYDLFLSTCNEGS